MNGLILGIETSCDETAVAVCDGRRVLSNIVASQIEEHRIYGGVVPEIASRRHAEAISAVCRSAVQTAGVALRDLSAVAVTFAPGLIGALLVGVNFAKGLALSLGVPLVPVHHLRGHIAANYLTAPDLTPPFLALVVSGGNTQLIYSETPTRFRTLGQTVDDAAGECFDKTARAMGLPYPGGAELDKIADPAGAALYRLPKPSAPGVFDWSFSGLKTAVLNILHNSAQRGEAVNIPALAGAVRHTVCEMLVEKTMAAASACQTEQIVLAGGVSANSELRARMRTACRRANIRFFVPEPRYCGDNGAMIAAQGAFELAAGHTAGCDLNASASLPVDYD